MQEQQPYQPNVELVFRLLTSALDEGAGVLKLYFTLSTGAVVLFTNLLVQSRTSKLVAAPLAVSIVAFGVEAAICLRLLMALVKVRSILADGIATGAPPETVKKKMDGWNKRAKKQGRLLEWFFWTGMAFALIFVASVLWAR